MKKLLTFSAFIILSAAIFSQTAVSVANGNWLNPMIWDCLCIPLPGYSVTINHNITMDTDFAYSSGQIIINSSGSLIQNIPNRNLHVFGTGYLSNSGTLQIKNILYEGTNGALMNSGVVSAGNIFISTGLDNIGEIQTDSIYNNSNLNNFGTILSVAMTNAQLCVNSGNIQVTDFTNMGDFTNEMAVLQCSNSFSNSGKLINNPFSEISAGNDFLNSHPSMNNALLENNGLLFIGSSLYNNDTIKGISGYIQVADSSVNAGYFRGTFDFCDLTPPANAPYVDFNTGFIDSGITWCTQQKIETLQTDLFTVFPNPAHNELNYKNSSHEIVSAKIFEAGGRNVLTFITSGVNGTFDISGLSPGTYFIVLNNTDELPVKRMFVKE